MCFDLCCPRMVMRATGNKMVERDDAVKKVVCGFGREAEQLQAWRVYVICRLYLPYDGSVVERLRSNEFGGVPKAGKQARHQPLVS